MPAQRPAPGGRTPGGTGADVARDGATEVEPESTLSDRELLRRHVDGDAEAFGELFLRHKDRLWAVALRTLGNPEDAADALQDAMISAFRRAGSFRGESAVTTWLHRIVVNACLDKMRRRTARPEVSGSDERTMDTMSREAGADPVASSDLSLEVEAALRQLPRDQRMALVLVDMLDYPVADAAEILGIAQGTVKSRCARGRTRLLPKLAHLRQGGVETLSGGPPGRDQQPSPPNSPPPATPGAESGNRLGPGAVLPAQEGSDEAH